MPQSSQTPTLHHPRYVSNAVLGNGTYSVVLAATDKQTGEDVAVKIAHREPAYRRSALAEATLLRALSASTNVIKMKDSFEHDGRIHIVLERLHKNLYEMLRDRKFEPLPLPQVREIGKRVLLGLAEVHGAGYIHCDVKPENIMLCRSDSTTDCVMIDFGAIRKPHENTYYDVQSLWYRAPEVICGLPYTTAIDMWSIGCMLFEIHTGAPLFSGREPQEQLSMIIDMFGPPSQDAMLRGKNAPSLSFTGMSASRRGRRQKVLEECVVGGDAAVNESFVNLLYQMLAPNEGHRITVAAALNHPFFHSGKMAPTNWMAHELSNGSFSGLTDNSSLSSPDWKRQPSLTSDDDDGSASSSATGFPAVSYRGCGLSLLSMPMRDNLSNHHAEETIAMLDDWLI